MSYALRNSLVIAVLLIFVLAIGIYAVEVRLVAHIDELQSRAAQLKVDLENINAVLAIYDSTLAELNRLKTRWQARTQIVPADDDPARTLAYLYELLQPLAVNFDFLYKGLTEKANHNVNTYALQGEGRFEDIYTFIWQLEHGRNFHTVDQLQLQYGEPLGEKRTATWHWIDFKVVFRMYFAPDSRVEDLPPLQEGLRPDPVARNPFRPLITKTLPKNRLGLFEVDGARLRGLAHNLAYLVDNKGQMHLLREGDRVFLGEVAKIDIGRNQMEFLMNRGGIWERIALSAATDTPQP